MSFHKFQSRVHEIIFEVDTPAGKLFDMALLVAIVASVLTVMLESVEEAALRLGYFIRIMEWVFTIIFSIEYLLRLISVKRPLKYALSFFGIVDLISILPTYISLVFSGVQYLLIVRILRLMRMFRILKLSRYVKESKVLGQALRMSMPKITVFLIAVSTIVVIAGAVMYIVEGKEHGFTSIPRSIYWAIVTMTTVGYGDITPKTVIGQAFSALLMITGYGIIAVPTGIVTAELSAASRMPVSTKACTSCSQDGHDPDAEFCKYCGESLND